MPFIEITAFQLGPLSIPPFGILVAIGVLVGTSVGAKYAVKHSMSEDALRYLGFKVIVLGLVMAHLLDVVLYTPGKLSDDPILLFRFWEGIASYGGILGATIAFSIYARKINAHYLRYGDAVVYGFTIGFTFGRMGCATAHDHLGRITDFPLAVTLPKLNRCSDLVKSGKLKLEDLSTTSGCQNWLLPDGTKEVTAHDLGLYEVFICAFLFLVLTLVVRFWKNRRPGTLIAIAALYYAPIRFCLDFLRFPDSDPKYLGLTPAQHLCIWTVIGGIVVLRAMRLPHNVSRFDTPEDLAALKVPGPKPKAAKDGDDKKSKPKAKAQVVRKKRK